MELGRSEGLFFSESQTPFSMNSSSSVRKKDRKIKKRAASALTYEHLRVRHKRGLTSSYCPWQKHIDCGLETEVSGSSGFSVERSDVGMVNLVGTIFRFHWAGILWVAWSVVLCLYCGFVHKQLVDGSFFKALGMLLAVLLSVRARNGVSRRQHVMRTVLDMGARARDLIQLAAEDCHKDLCSEEMQSRRRELRVLLEFTFAKIAHWFAVRELCYEGDEDQELAISWRGPLIEDLPVEFRKSALRLGSTLSLGMSPRPLFYYIREICDHTWDPGLDGTKIDRVSTIRRWHKQMDIEINGLIRHFDDLATFQEEVQPRQMTWLISSLICVYTSLYPWCVQDESAIVLSTTTLGMCMVFYGLNALTCEIEDPLLQRSHGFNLSLIFDQLFRNMECEEALHQRCRVFLQDLDPADVCEDICRQFVSQELDEHGPFHLGVETEHTEQASEHDGLLCSHRDMDCPEGGRFSFCRPV